MRIIKPEVAPPALTLEFTGEEAEKFMEFLFQKEPPYGFLDGTASLFTQLYYKGYRRSGA